MKKDAEVFISHIEESIDTIEGYMKGKTKEGFMRDKQLQDAVIRRLEIIGEAVKNISAPFTQKHGLIPWKQIAGLRDKLIHHYFGVDLELTFDVIRNELPKLKRQLKQLKT